MKEKIRSIKSFKEFDDSPFEIKGIELKINQYGSKEERAVTEDGEELYIRKIKSESVLKDTLEYRKVYKESFVTIKDFGTPALRIFCYIAVHLKPKKEEIYINMELCNEFCGYNSRQPFYQGIVELLEKEVIAKKRGSDHYYFINPNVFFNGERVTLYNKKLVEQL